MYFVRFVLAGLLVLACSSTGWAEDYELANKSTLTGEIASADEDGVVVKLDIGEFSKRVPWVRFSQETLRKLQRDGRYSEFVGPFIEMTREEWIRKNRKTEPVIRPVAGKIELPSPKPSMLSAWMTPIGLGMLFALLAANLYAAYEIALFRRHNIALVCGLSFIIPLVGPIVFLAIPSPQEEAPADEPAADLADSSLSVPTGAEKSAGGGLSLAAAEKSPAASALTEPQVYKRGEATFNRRFFETKFSGFFRVVLGDAERDLVLVFRTAKQEYIGKRISRISMKELHLVLAAGGEQMIMFGDITSVILKHKDAKL